MEVSKIAEILPLVKDVAFESNWAIFFRALCLNHSIIIGIKLDPWKFDSLTPPTASGTWSPSTVREFNLEIWVGNLTWIFPKMSCHSWSCLEFFFNEVDFFKISLWQRSMYSSCWVRSLIMLCWVLGWCPRTVCQWKVKFKREFLQKMMIVRVVQYKLALRSR